MNKVLFNFTLSQLHSYTIYVGVSNFLTNSDRRLFYSPKFGLNWCNIIFSGCSHSNADESCPEPDVADHRCDRRQNHSVALRIASQHGRRSWSGALEVKCPLITVKIWIPGVLLIPVVKCFPILCVRYPDHFAFLFSEWGW